MSRYLRTLPLLGLGAALFGCGEGREPLALGDEQSAVIGGVPSNPAHDGVVDIYTPTSGCSGSLIAPNVVLTALHCVVAKSSDTFTCNTDGTASMGGDLGALLPASSLLIKTGVGPDAAVKAVGKQLFSTGSTNACKWDLALIVLDQDIDAPLIPLRLGRPTEPGEATTVIGYGYIDNDTRTVKGRQERDNVDVLYVGADLWHSASQFASPDTLVVGEGPCHGDSGAPLLSMETGAAIGVSSVILSSCQGAGVQSAYTEVASFESTIRQALTYAGHDPVLEQTGAQGDAGAGGQGGEFSVGEGGVATGAAGSPELGTGGRTDTGSGGSHAGALGGTAGKAGGENASAGTAASDSGTGVVDSGSGSRRDPACTCRAAGSKRESRSLAAMLAFALGVALRRRSRRA